MITAFLCTSVNQSITPEGKRDRCERNRHISCYSHCFTVSASPVVPGAAQAAVIAGLAVDTAGFTLGGGGVAVVSSDWFVKII